MKKAIVVVAVLAAVLALGGCGASNTSDQNSSSGGTTNNTSSNSSSSNTSSDSKAKDTDAEKKAAAEKAAAEKAAAEKAAAEKAAAEKAAAEKAKKAKEAEKAKEGSPLSKSQVTKIIEDDGYGEVVDMKESKLSDGKWYWEVTASLDDGSVHTYLVGPDGVVTSQDKDSGTAGSGSSAKANELTKSEVKDIIWKQGLGDVVSMEKVTEDDNVQYWKVVTRGASGNKKTFVIDPNGNVSED